MEVQEEAVQVRILIEGNMEVLEVVWVIKQKGQNDHFWMSAEIKYWFARSKILVCRPNWAIKSKIVQRNIEESPIATYPIKTALKGILFIVVLFCVPLKTTRPQPNNKRENAENRCKRKETSPNAVVGGAAVGG